MTDSRVPTDTEDQMQGFATVVLVILIIYLGFSAVWDLIVDPGRIPAVIIEVVVMIGLLMILVRLRSRARNKQSSAAAVVETRGAPAKAVTTADPTNSTVAITPKPPIAAQVEALVAQRPKVEVAPEMRASMNGERAAFIAAYGSDTHAMTSGVRDSGEDHDDLFDDDWLLGDEKPARTAMRPNSSGEVDCPGCGERFFTFMGDSETCDECKTVVVASIDRGGALCFRTRADHEDRITNAMLYGGFSGEDAVRLFGEVVRLPLRKWEFRQYAELGITEVTYFSFVLGTCTACSERNQRVYPLREIVSEAPLGCVCQPCRCQYFPKFEKK